MAFLQPLFQGYGGLEAYSAHMLQALGPSSVEVVSAHPVDPARLLSAFGVDLSDFRFRVDPRCAPDGSSRSLDAYAALTREYEEVVGVTVSLPPPCRAARSTLVCHFPVVRQDRLGLAGGWAGPLTSAGRRERAVRSRLAGWGRILTCSEFSRRWIRRYWDRDAVVVHPPVPLPDPPPDLSRKQPWILAAGFFSPPEGDDPWGYKRQDFLVGAFRRLVERGLSGWELHLAGHAEDRPDVRAFLARLRSEAEGLPVRFHPNCPRSELEALFRLASLFWHAVGYGIDPEERPERTEHFGIVTAEAMAWGAVPVVVNRGGQPEIVEHERTGLLWTEEGELLDGTLRLARDRPLREELSRAGMAAAVRFSPERFAREVRALDWGPVAAGVGVNSPR